MELSWVEIILSVSVRGVVDAVVLEIAGVRDAWSRGERREVAVVERVAIHPRLKRSVLEGAKTLWRHLPAGLPETLTTYSMNLLSSV